MSDTIIINLTEAAIGQQGLSAYQVAVAGGYPGSESDWLASLKGDAATLAIGPITTGAPGTQAIATNTGTSQHAVLELTIPRGDVGEAATISIGSVTTGAPGSAASAVNVGNAQNAVINLTIPRGDMGPAGGITGGTFSGQVELEGQALVSGKSALNRELGDERYANLAGPQTLSGAQTFTGPVKLTGLELSDPSSAINVGQADARYAEAATPKEQWEALATSDPLDAGTQLAIRDLIDAGSDGLLYGSGSPDDSLGDDGQLYVDDLSGALYKKSGGTWSPSFTPSPEQVYFVTALPASGFGANGDLAVIYSAGIITGLAEKTAGTWTQIAGNTPPAPPKPTDAGVISLVDHFIGGKATALSGDVCGELNWYVLDCVGTGNVKGVSDNSKFNLGVAKISTGATAGNVTTIQFSNGTDSGNTFPLSSLSTNMAGMVMRWKFRVDTAGDFYIGLSNNPRAADLKPTRFAGIKALAGAPNFSFESTTATPNPVDTGVAVDAAWHTFEMRYDIPTEKWLMSLDGGTPIAVNRTIGPSLTMTLAVWVKSNGGVQTAFLDTFQIYGIQF